ncbi:toll/interleukin-1 receptor domain-containing protein [Clostridium sp. DJ247]|uniref:toll/interleukin-1 receptor domain-containing protein n=1 Tax=Clostridium sp. DJ247 TaxID=2726188 RepID=UPI001629218C|nr:toll/interleukin-1 receptor domain-containing protein [Clostridium sp. DJ247]MBC2579678.1 hypothetical protein [Clostridium sp. DJ247]
MLKLGDKLLKSINRGIADSKAGIIIISKNFMHKEFTEYELETLENLFSDDTIKLIPIWHGVTKKDLKKYRPSLLIPIGIDSSSSNLTEIAIKIVEAIRPDIFENLSRLVYEEYLRRHPQYSCYVEDEDTLKALFDIVKHSPMRHDVLPKTLVSRMKIILKIFQEYLNISEEDWINNFRKDLNPKRETIIWEVILLTYLEFLNNREVSNEYKWEVYFIALSTSTHSKFNAYNFKYLSAEDIDKLQSLYYKNLIDSGIASINN